MPLYNFRKCTEGDLTFIRVDSREYEVNDYDLQAFQFIQDEIIDTYGEVELVYEYRQDRIRLHIAKCNWIIERRNFYRNEIDFYEEKLKGFLKEMNKGVSISQALIYISRDLAGGNPLNEKNITVKQYLDYVKEYERANKKK